MMESLRSATRNTGFERWLDATLRPQPQADAPALPAGDSPKVPAHPLPLHQLRAAQDRLSGFCSPSDAAPSAYPHRPWIRLDRLCSGRHTVLPGIWPWMQVSDLA